jgi:hypothetical protein
MYIVLPSSESLVQVSSSGDDSSGTSRGGANG